MELFEDNVEHRPLWTSIYCLSRQMALQTHSHEWGVAVLVTSMEVGVCHGCALFMVFVMVTPSSELLEDFDFKPK